MSNLMYGRKELTEALKTICTAWHHKQRERIEEAADKIPKTQKLDKLDSITNYLKLEVILEWAS